jgi:DNA mismatch repair protein MutS2
MPSRSAAASPHTTAPGDPRRREACASWQDSETEPGAEDVARQLAELPGLGPRLLEKATATLGSQQALLEAIKRGDTETLTQVPGISPRLANRLSHHATGTDPGGFFGTERAARLFEVFQTHLIQRALTRGGRNQLRLLAPLPDEKRRAERLAWCRQAAQEAANTDLEAAREHLRRLEPLPPPRPSFEADVLLLFDTPQDLQAAREAGLHQWAPLTHLKESGLLERVQESHLVIHPTDDPSARPHRLEEADHLVTIGFTLDPARLAPWSIITRLEKGRKTLEAAAALSQTRGLDAPSQQALKRLQERTQAPKTWDAGEAWTRAQVILEEELQQAEKELQQLTLTGTELMRALHQEIPPAVARLYQQATKRANDRLEKETGLVLEAYTETLPPQVDEDAIRHATQSAARTSLQARRAHEHETAQQLAALLPEIEKEIEDHEAFDARLAIGTLWNDHTMTSPEWGDGLLVEGLRPMHIDNGEPIDYRLGLTEDAKTDGTRVALLTGANSGGKTTLLESLTLLVTLAHTGLGVPAKRAILPQLDSVHLYAPRRDRSAGALESLLLDLFPLTQESGARLVLADELEAITELEAACEIIAELLEGLIEQGTHAVLATHLAPHLLPSLDPEARRRTRVDGIEAIGLDENGRLQVHRSPRLGKVARSTPELILQRLATHGPPGLSPRFQRLAGRVRSRMEAAEKTE